jgi:hypothetical protein
MGDSLDPEQFRATWLWLHAAIEDLAVQMMAIERLNVEPTARQCVIDQILDRCRACRDHLYQATAALPPILHPPDLTQPAKGIPNNS